MQSDIKIVHYGQPLYINHMHFNRRLWSRGYFACHADSSIRIYICPLTPLTMATSACSQSSPRRDSTGSKT